MTWRAGARTPRHLSHSTLRNPGFGGVRSEASALHVGEIGPILAGERGFHTPRWELTVFEGI